MASDLVYRMPVQEGKRARKSRFQGAPAEYTGPIRGQLARQLYDRLRLLRKQPSSRLSSGELTARELEAIDALGHRGKSSMTQLAEGCGFLLSTMTSVVDRLVKKGLVNRERTEEDRRIVLVELTERGRVLFSERLEMDMGLILSMLQALNPQEQETLVKLIDKATASLALGRKG